MMRSRKNKKSRSLERTENEIRNIVLNYFYERHKNATSARGKRGYAVKISDVRKDLKADYGLTQKEVVRSINYLISQGWLEEEQVAKSVPLPSGTIIPQATSYYKITAAGIDKIEGPGEFTMERFKGIKIEATGQNIITIGDGNQVNAKFESIGNALVDLKNAVLRNDSLTEEQKMEVVADIDTIESQLAKAQPNTTVIKNVWENIKNLDTILGLTEKVKNVASLLAPFL